MGKCIFCENENCERKRMDFIDAFEYKCLNCGTYKIEIEGIRYVKELTKIKDKAKISNWICINQGKFGILTMADIEKTIRNHILPQLGEQIDNLLFYLCERNDIFNKVVMVNPQDLIALTGAVNKSGVDFIMDFLIKNGFLTLIPKRSSSNNPNYNVKITVEGWQRFYELQRTNKYSRLAFMAMQFNNSTLQNVLKDIIVPAVKETGFDIRKLDDEKRAGLIDDKLRVEIRRSKFVIADLTDVNRGAYWEAGFAEGLGTPVIYICEEEKFNSKDKNISPHFDTNHHLTVPWKNDEAGLKKFADELKATIRATFPDEAIMND